MEEGVRVASLNGRTDAVASSTVLSITTSDDSAGEKLSSHKKGWKFYAALGVICQVNIVAALDASVISTALPVSSTVGFHRFWLQNKQIYRKPENKRRLAE
jgi:hypothetical protein